MVCNAAGRMAELQGVLLTQTLTQTQILIRTRTPTRTPDPDPDLDPVWGSNEKHSAALQCVIEVDVIFLC